MNRAVTALNTVTHRNAALVDEARQAADALREQSARLVEAVGAFAMEQPGATQAA